MRKIEPLEQSNLPKKSPSPQQQAVLDWVDKGRGSRIVVAVAGSGKSTTGANACSLMRGSVASVMYGRKAANEFQSKLTNMGLKHVKNNTAHGFGIGAWRYANKGRDIKVDDKEKWARILAKVAIPEDFQGFVKELVSLAKQRAVGFLQPTTEDFAWYDIVDHFGLEYELTSKYDGAVDQDMVARGVEYARLALSASNDLAREIVDFDDMPYLPLIYNCRMWQNDWIFVDEAQDTNPARRALYKKMLRPGGRALFVGDPYQAIFGFTGADNDALEIIGREFSASRMPLTTTFRCPKSVVAWAQCFVPHIQAADTNPEGEVSHTTYQDFLEEGVSQLLSQDAVLCRNTAPLVDLAFGLIRRNVPCHVEGKKIGEGLVALAKRWKTTSLDVLRSKLEEFLDQQVRKLMAKGKEQQAANLDDRVKTLEVMIDSLPPRSTVNDLHKKVDEMFGDTLPGQRAENLTLCTAHRSKGLEWGNVYLLGRDRYMPSPFARQAWQQDQERNLTYVAGTRAMSRLVEVDAPPMGNLQLKRRKTQEDEKKEES